MARTVMTMPTRRITIPTASRATRYEPLFTATCPSGADAGWPEGSVTGGITGAVATGAAAVGCCAGAAGQGVQL